MDYGEVLSKSWKIIWKFKALWLFGILAGCGASRGANFNFNNSYRVGGNGVSGPTPSLPPQIQQALYRFGLLFRDPAFIWKFLAVTVGIICILVLIQIVLSVMGRIGLIKGAAEADAGAERLAFGQLWKGSAPYFWRMVWLTLLLGGPFAVFAVVMVAVFIASLIPLARNNPDPSAGVAFLTLLFVLLGLFCVVFLLAIIIGFISRQAERAIVLENKPVLDSIKRGWEVLTKNLGPILLIWIIQLAISIIAGIVIALPLLAVLVPFMIIFLSSASGANSPSTTWLITLVFIVLAYLPVSWLANGILMAYLESVWTLTYIRLTKPKQDVSTPVALPANA